MTVSTSSRPAETAGRAGRGPLRGVQTPRIWNAPRAPRSLGQDVVELAGLAGLKLDPWQQFVLKHGLGLKAGGRWSAFEVALIVARQNGKNSILEALELAALFDWQLPLTLHTAHHVKTSSEHFLRIRTLIENCDELRRRANKPRVANGEQQISTLNGARLRFVARRTTSGRGFTADLIVLDEAFDLSGETMAALLPTLSSIPNPQVWYSSSAPLSGSTQLRAIQARGRAGGGGRFAYFEWSAPADVDPTDRRGWAQANPALGIRIDPEFVEAELAAMPAQQFLCERLGVSEEETDQTVIPLTIWEALADDGSRLSHPVVFAVDASPDRSRWAIAAAAQQVEGDNIHVELIDVRDGQQWVTGRLAELVDRWKPIAVVVDAGAAAGSILPELALRGIEPMTPTARQVAQACGAFYDAAVNGRLAHPGEPVLVDAIVGARKRDLADSWAWSRRTSAVDITPLVAVTLAHWGWNTKTAERLDVTANIW